MALCCVTVVLISTGSLGAHGRFVQVGIGAQGFVYVGVFVDTLEVHDSTLVFLHLLQVSRCF